MPISTRHYFGPTGEVGIEKDFGLVGETGTHLLIAASNASAAVKARASAVCTGTNDEVVIQAAIDEIMARSEPRGVVELSVGDFNLYAPITWYNLMTLKGQGYCSLTRLWTYHDGAMFAFDPDETLATTRIFGGIERMYCGGRNAAYTVNAVSTGAGGTITLANCTAADVGASIRVWGSTNNDGTWTVASAVQSGADVVVTVDGGETVNATADGTATLKGAAHKFIDNTSDTAHRFFDFQLKEVFAHQFGGVMIDSHQAWGWVIHDAILEEGDSHALQFDPTQNASASGGLKLRGCKIKGFRDSVIRIRGGSGWSITGTEFYTPSKDSTAAGNYALLVDPLTSKNASQILFNNNIITIPLGMNAGGCILLRGGGSYGTVNTFTITGNVFFASADPPADYNLIKTEASANFGIVTGNVLRGALAADGHNRHANQRNINCATRSVQVGANFGAMRAGRTTPVSGEQSLRQYDFGGTFIATGTGATICTLPPTRAEDVGAEIAFTTLGSGRLAVRGDTDSRIEDSTNAGYIYSDDSGGISEAGPYLRLKLLYFSAGTSYWGVISKLGTWTTAAALPA